MYVHILGMPSRQARTDWKKTVVTMYKEFLKETTRPRPRAVPPQVIVACAPSGQPGRHAVLFAHWEGTTLKPSHNHRAPVIVTLMKTRPVPSRSSVPPLPTAPKRR